LSLFSRGEQQHEEVCKKIGSLAAAAARYRKERELCLT